MPKPGLSLVGFMDQAQALQHLQVACVPANGATDADLIAIHAGASARLGAPVSGAGNPEILPLSAAANTHITQLIGQPWAQAILQIPSMAGYSFQLVEIDPLLSFQLTVMTDRSAEHCGALNNPTIEQMLPVALPLVQPRWQFILSPITPGSQSVIIKSRDLNFQMTNWGVFPIDFGGAETHFAGMGMRSGSPFVYVARFNGRCYLANGFHRAYGLRKAGATHVPCVFRDAATADEIGIRADGSTFPLQRLEADNPPTVGHYARDRAQPVTLRTLSRFLHVSWSQYVLPED